MIVFILIYYIAFCDLCIAYSNSFLFFYYCSFVWTDFYNEAKNYIFLLFILPPIV